MHHLRQNSLKKKIVTSWNYSEWQERITKICKDEKESYGMFVDDNLRTKWLHSDNL